MQVKTQEKGLFVAPLGAEGMQALRDARGPKAAKARFDAALPACYIAALPAFYRGKRRLACPSLEPKTGFSVASVYSQELYLTILRGGQHW